MNVNNVVKITMLSLMCFCMSATRMFVDMVVHQLHCVMYTDVCVNAYVSGCYIQVLSYDPLCVQFVHIGTYRCLLLLGLIFKVTCM